MKAQKWYSKFKMFERMHSRLIMSTGLSSDIITGNVPSSETVREDTILT